MSINHSYNSIKEAKSPTKIPEENNNKKEEYLLTNKKNLRLN
jgi:hypothetical protein